jgi:hypothetical protein
LDEVGPAGRRVEAKDRAIFDLKTIKLDDGEFDVESEIPTYPNW